jgi:hypothetical protein
LHIIDPFDESLKRGTQITPPLGEKAESVGVPIYAGTICETVLLR